MRHVCPECGESGEPGPCTKDGTERAPSGTDALLGERIGSWRIAKLIGTGGMGRVYLGVQPEIGARVAIKVLRNDDTDAVERFFNEARAVNVIRHEGIVDIIDLGRLESGAPYIVMELLHGVPLRALIHRTPRPNAGALAKLVVDVLAALEAAHAKGVIHRDLKPDNVFVSPAGRVTVLDFGVAKLAHDAHSHTQTGGLLGTPAYMAPEQARGVAVDARADVYALGVVLYEAATGQLPFAGPSTYALLDQHIHATPVSPREIDPAVPEALEVVILRALAKRPADRYASAADMRAALVAALEPLPKAELQLPAIAPVAPAADPHGATVVTNASTLPPRPSSESLAYGDTRASGDLPRAKPISGPPAERTVRVSRGLVAVMAGSALLGLGAVAYVIIRDREPTRVAVVADAPPGEPYVEPPPDLMKGPAPLALPSITRFDPAAYYDTAFAKAEWVAGGKVRPVKVLWRGFDRDGFIDLNTGAAEYLFVPLAPKSPGWCYILVILEEGKGRISIGSSESPCDSINAIQTPRCTIPQMWERALADGMPADAKLATANMMGRWWVFSTPGEDTTHDIKNDCSPP